MTDTLTHLLHERAAAVRLDPPHADALARAGRRRLRRRRWSAVGGVTALVVAAVGVTTLLPRHDRPVPTPPVRPLPTVAVDVTWARGSTIHIGDRRIDVRHEVATLVRTTVGFLFTDQGHIVWSAVDGRITRLGVTADPLVSDPTGTLAGWVDGSGGGRLSYHVIDQATGETWAFPGRARSLIGPSSAGYVDGGIIALDGDTMYWQDGARTLSATVGGRPRALAQVSQWGGELLSVRDRVAIVQSPAIGQLLIASLATGARLIDVAGGGIEPAGPSPDASWVAVAPLVGDGRHSSFVRSATGSAVVPDAGAWSSLAVQWLGPDVAVVLVAAKQTSHYRLDVCTLGADRCDVAVADLGEGPTTGGNGLGFALPIGDHYFPYPHG